MPDKVLSEDKKLCYDRNQGRPERITLKTVKRANIGVETQCDKYMGCEHSHECKYSWSSGANNSYIPNFG